MSGYNKRGWAGDVAGGATAALTALPVELVYGLFAVAPLGAAYADHGLRAALWGCILGGVLGLLLRSTGGMLTGSRPASALILGTLAAALLQHVEVQAADDPAALVFVLLLLCTALAGLFQLVFGMARVGRALKYAPYPVIAGLMCGVGLLMVLAALRPALGIDYGTPWRDALAAWHPLSIVVTAATLALCFLVPRWSRRVPSTVVALLGGTLLHHALFLLAGAGVLGATSGNVDGLLPAFSVWQAVFARGAGSLLGWLPTLAPYALAIAAFASLETLLCLAAIESATHQRGNGDRELRTQGLTNLLSGVLGGTPSIGNLSRVMVNLSAGGRSAFSGLAYAATLTLVVVLAGSWTGLVPSAATAGILIFYAISMVDDGTRRQLVQLLTQRAQLARAQYRLLLANFGVIVLVALVAVLGDMMKALGVGVAAAMFIFVRMSMKPVVRRVFNAQYHRSLKVRAHEEMQLLEREGSRIAVIEVEGPLFFGTADRVALEIENVAKNAASLILDLKRVSDVDPTGARTLLQAANKLKARQRVLLLSGANQRVEHFLRTMGLEAAVAAEDWYHDLDTALERLEDALLAKHDVNVGHAVVRLSETGLADGLSEAQTNVLEAYLSKRLFESEGTVFCNGDVGNSLFVATGSVVDILLPLQNGSRKRVASFAPGVVFGEMALLEGKTRSADAVVQGPSMVWELKRECLHEIEFKHPEIARTILFNLSRSLAERLRMTTVALRLSAEG
ncbi:MAG: SulP family inorganic anion transporter [Rhodocyclaceae bacterium]